MPEAAKATTNSSNSSNSNNSSHFVHWQTTWKDFQRALYAPPTESFHPFVWLYRLLQAAFQDAAVILLRLDDHHRVMNIIMPILGLSLIATVMLAYVAILRRTVIQERWCCCHWRLAAAAAAADLTTTAADETITTLSPNDDDCSCYWLWMHDAILTYLSLMTLFYFGSSILQSPGVVVVADESDIRISAEAAAKKDCRRRHPFGWWYPQRRLDLQQREQERLQQFYGSNFQNNKTAAPLLDKKKSPIKTTTTTTTTTTIHDGDSRYMHCCYYPDPDTSYCMHCQHTRPPRSHHCSTCGVCILQYDHHCVWLGSCIGYGNYRSFVGLLFYLTISCAYGVYILFGPFYEPLRDQIQEYGWKSLFGSNGTMGSGFWELPAWPELLHILSHCQQHDETQKCTKIVVDVLYPLLCGAGSIMAVFLGQHVKYILHGHTTLEHRVVLQQQLQWWKQRASALWKSMNLHKNNSSSSNNSKKKNKDTPTKPEVLTNPFDQGWYRNLLQVVGKHWWLFFLPIPVTPPPPYLPRQKSN